MNRKEIFNDDFENGYAYENEFFEFLKSIGFIPVKATNEVDMKKHIDLYYYEGGPSVDVKGVKYIGGVMDDNYTVIEYKNVKGDRGWIFGSADYIVFATRTEWIVVSRLKLIKLLLEKVVNISVPKFSQCLYCHHTRHGNDDDITMIPTKDLREIAENTYVRLDTRDHWVIGYSVIHSERVDQVAQGGLKANGFYEEKKEK